MIEIGLLGPLSVHRRGGEAIAIASESQRRLLSVLALHVDAAVRAATLEDCLDLSPGALRTSISRLRRALGADVLQTTPPGYALHAQVDVADFDLLLRRAPTVVDDVARGALEEAVELWRGEPVDEFAHEPWAEPEVSLLNERYAVAVEDLAVLLLDAGEASNALLAIQRLVDAQPYRDRPRALLMRALADIGRRTDALRVFQSYRTLLLDEIGTEPSGSVVELDRAIASLTDESVLVEPRPGHPAWRRYRRLVEADAAWPRHGLPSPLSSFVGRGDDLRTVSDLLHGNRLVTLTGAGGCGKTRLALAVATAEAEHRAECTRWAELGLVTRASQVVEQVATATGLALQPGADQSLQLIEHLSTGSPTLLVLDNAEHLLSPVVDLVSALLAGCPMLRVLVTSREPLRLAGETVWRVPSLATPPAGISIGVEDVADNDALQLFLVRARSARPGLVVDAEAVAHMTAICAGVDGLPLALELAAARTRTLPVEVVANGIGDAVRWQSAASRAPLARHATLHASIGWSVDLVEPAARSVLIRLSVFQSSFTLDAALAVGGAGEPDDDVAGAVSALVDASLLNFDDATGRYRMLRTVRQFCSLRARGADELDPARARHARHVATYCKQVGEGLRGIERGPFLREMPDVVSAVEWARDHEPRLVFEMCAGLASVRSALGYNSNTIDTWTWLLSLDRDAGPDPGVDAGRSGAWAAAVAALMSSLTAHAVDVSGVVEEVSRLLPSDAHRARGWLARGAAMGPAYQGRLAPILAHAQDTAARRDDIETSIYGGFVAYMLALTGRLDELSLQLEVLRRLTRGHHVSFRVDTVGNGYAAAVLGDLHRGELRSATTCASERIPDDPAFSMTAAAALAHTALLSCDAATMQRAVAWSQRGTIPLLWYLETFINFAGRLLDGDVDGAAGLAEQFWEESVLVPVSRVHPLPLLASAMVAGGRTSAAVSAIELADELVQAMEPSPLLEAGVLAGRALLAAHLGQWRTVAEQVEPLLDTTVEHGFALMTIDALELVAGAAANEPTVAGHLSAAAAAERNRLGYRYRPPPTQDRRAPAVGSTKAGATSPGTGPASIEEAVASARRWAIDIRADARL